MTPPVWLLDLDGVVWLGDRPITGAAAAVGRIRSAGAELGFVTNNSHATVDEYLAKLARHGIEARPAELVTSAMALATLVVPGETVLVCGGPGLRDAVSAAGGTVVDHDDHGGRDRPVDVVAVGFDPTFDYARMRRATRAVLDGARLVASNDDPIYPSSDGPSPGAGAILASIERATAVVATVAGKPHPAMADVVRQRFGDSGVMVGDSLGTDGAFAGALGWPFGLVLSGNTTAGEIPDDQPRDWVADDLAALVEHRFGPSGPDTGP